MSKTSSSLFASLETLAAALGWSALGSLILFLPEHVSPFTISGFRGVSISIAFLAIGFYRGKSVSFRKSVLSAGVCYAASAITYIMSLKLLPVIVATPLHYTTPAWMVGGLYLIFGRWPGRAEICGVLLSLLGAFVLIYSAGVSSIVGVGMAILSAVLWAGYLYLQGEMSTDDRFSAAMWGGVALFVSGFADFGMLTLRGTEIPIFVMIAILSSILPLLLVAHASKRLSAVPVSLLLLSEPGFAALLAFYINGQAPSAITLTGLVLITLGAVFGALFPAGNEKAFDGAEVEKLLTIKTAAR